MILHPKLPSQPESMRKHLNDTFLHLKLKVNDIWIKDLDNFICLPFQGGLGFSAGEQSLRLNSDAQLYSQHQTHEIRKMVQVSFRSPSFLLRSIVIMLSDHLEGDSS
ncbi:hypothetical protein Tco_0937219 [Tanacetum coccineum]|uniref:Uncharacterized protein n=1 Tax=Tanacetum coccineum TaxID=301880 RepID=A0ABQ5DEC8_9ASTR